MQLDRLALHLRRRTPMEAIDLGCAMARRWWWPVLAAWLPLCAGAAVLGQVLFYGNSLAAILVLWWLKPLLDRAALEVLGRRVFGEEPRLRDVLAAVFRSPGLIPSLTYYRFDLARSFNLPIWHLERLRGGAASRRARALHGRSRRHAVWATIVFLHFEVVVLLTLWGAIDLFTPDIYEAEFGLKALFGSDMAPWQQWLHAGFYAVTVTLIEPFYVAAGFALYLNRRTQLEAWDVELALRRYAQRERSGPNKGPGAVVSQMNLAALAALIAVAIAAAAVPAGMAMAAESGSPKAKIQQILAEPAFDRHQDVKRLRYIGPGWDSGWSPSDKAPEKGGSVTWIAELLRVLVWIAVGSLVALALYYLRRFVPQWRDELRPARTPPSAMFGLEIAPESLPADVAGAALGAIEAGNVRGGLSLLYRGALSVLVHGGGLEVAAGDTEGDCVRRVSGLGDAGRARFFGALVAAWQSAAYAGRVPEENVLRVLCREWPAHFAAAAA